MIATAATTRELTPLPRTRRARVGTYVAHSEDGSGWSPGSWPSPPATSARALTGGLDVLRDILGRGKPRLCTGPGNRTPGRYPLPLSFRAMTDEQKAISQTTLEAVANLLEAGKRYGIGITFEPDEEGWSIGYMRGMGGGDLASAYDLETAVKAAERPLDELAQRLAENRASRERG
jgi:hypothetical protein